MREFVVQPVLHAPTAILGNVEERRVKNVGRRSPGVRADSVMRFTRGTSQRSGPRWRRKHEDLDEMEKVVIEEVASSEEETAAWKRQQEVPAEEDDAARAGYQWTALRAYLVNGYATQNAMTAWHA